MSRWGKTKHWTREAILHAIRQFFATYHQWPLTADFRERRDELPHGTTVIRTFGTLAEARRQAGMPSGGHEGLGGGWPGGRPWGADRDEDRERQRQHMLRLVAARKGQGNSP
jgi:hypothetical protein